MLFLAFPHKHPSSLENIGKSEADICWCKYDSASCLEKLVAVLQAKRRQKPRRKCISYFKFCSFQVSFYFLQLTISDSRVRLYSFFTCYRVWRLSALYGVLPLLIFLIAAVTHHLSSLWLYFSTWLSSCLPPCPCECQ